jgi:putative transposase
VGPYYLKTHPVVFVRNVAHGHRELVQRKWTYLGRHRPGRPPLDPDVRDLILRMGRENATWSSSGSRVSSESSPIRISATDDTYAPSPPRPGTAGAPVRADLLPVPQDPGARHPRRRLLTVETLWLKTICVLFFIEVGIRRVRVCGVTAHPDSAWVTQQARNLSFDLGDVPYPYASRSETGTPSTPQASTRCFDRGRNHLHPRPGSASGWVRTVRTECLDRTLVFGRSHLERIPRISTTTGRGRTGDSISELPRPAAVDPSIFQRPVISAAEISWAGCSMSTTWQHDGTGISVPFTPTDPATGRPGGGKPVSSALATYSRMVPRSAPVGPSLAPDAHAVQHRHRQIVDRHSVGGLELEDCVTPRGAPGLRTRSAGHLPRAP